MNDKLFTADEIAAVTGITAARVRRIAAQYGRGRYIGRQWVFTQDDYDWFLVRPDHRRKEYRA